MQSDDLQKIREEEGRVLKRENELIDISQLPDDNSLKQRLSSGLHNLASKFSGTFDELRERVKLEGRNLEEDEHTSTSQASTMQSLGNLDDHNTPNKTPSSGRLSQYGESAKQAAHDQAQQIKSKLVQKFGAKPNPEKDLDDESKENIKNINAEIMEQSHPDEQIFESEGSAQEKLSFSARIGQLGQDLRSGAQHQGQQMKSKMLEKFGAKPNPEKDLDNESKENLKNINAEILEQPHPDEQVVESEGGAQEKRNLSSKLGEFGGSLREGANSQAQQIKSKLVQKFGAKPNPEKDLDDQSKDNLKNINQEIMEQPSRGEEVVESQGSGNEKLSASAKMGQFGENFKWEAQHQAQLLRSRMLERFGAKPNPEKDLDKECKEMIKNINEEIMERGHGEEDVIESEGAAKEGRFKRLSNQAQEKIGGLKEQFNQNAPPQLKQGFEFLRNMSRNQLNQLKEYMLYNYGAKVNGFRDLDENMKAQLWKVNEEIRQQPHGDEQVIETQGQVAEKEENPKEGGNEEVNEMLGKKLDESLQRIRPEDKHFWEEATEKINQMKEKAQEKGQEIKQEIQQKGQEIKQEAQEKKQELQEKAPQEYQPELNQEGEQLNQGKGQELKQRIQEKGQELKEKAQEIKQDLKQEGEQLKQQAQEKKQELQEKAPQEYQPELNQEGEQLNQGKGQELKQRIQEKGQELKEKAQEIKQDLKQEGEQLKQQAQEKKQESQPQGQSGEIEHHQLSADSPSFEPAKEGNQESQEGNEQQYNQKFNEELEKIRNEDQSFWDEAAQKLNRLKEQALEKGQEIKQEIQEKGQEIKQEAQEKKQELKQEMQPQGQSGEIEHHQLTAESPSFQPTEESHLLAEKVKEGLQDPSVTLMEKVEEAENILHEEHQGDNNQPKEQENEGDKKPALDSLKEGAQKMSNKISEKVGDMKEKFQSRQDNKEGQEQTYERPQMEQEQPKGQQREEEEPESQRAVLDSLRDSLSKKRQPKEGQQEEENQQGESMQEEKKPALDSLKEGAQNLSDKISEKVGDMKEKFQSRQDNKEGQEQSYEKPQMEEEQPKEQIAEEKEEPKGEQEGENLNEEAESQRATLDSLNLKKVPEGHEEIQEQSQSGNNEQPQERQPIIDRVLGRIHAVSDNIQHTIEDVRNALKVEESQGQPAEGASERKPLLDKVMGGINKISNTIDSIRGRNQQQGEEERPMEQNEEAQEQPQSNMNEEKQSKEMPQEESGEMPQEGNNFRDRIMEGINNMSNILSSKLGNVKGMLPSRKEGENQEEKIEEEAPSNQEEQPQEGQSLVGRIRGGIQGLSNNLKSQARSLQDKISRKKEEGEAEGFHKVTEGFSETVEELEEEERIEPLISENPFDALNEESTGKSEEAPESTSSLPQRIRESGQALQERVKGTIQDLSERLSGLEICARRRRPGDQKQENNEEETEEKNEGEEESAEPQEQGPSIRERISGRLQGVSNKLSQNFQNIKGRFIPKKEGEAESEELPESLGEEQPQEEKPIEPQEEEEIQQEEEPLKGSEIAREPENKPAEKPIEKKPEQKMDFSDFHNIDSGFSESVSHFEKEQRGEPLHCENPFDALGGRNINISQPLNQAQVVGGHLDDLTAGATRDNVILKKLPADMTMPGEFRADDKMKRDIANDVKEFQAEDKKSLMGRAKEGMHDASSMISGKIGEAKEKIKSVFSSEGKENLQS